MPAKPTPFSLCRPLRLGIHTRCLEGETIESAAIHCSCNGTGAGVAAYWDLRETAIHVLLLLARNPFDRVLASVQRVPVDRFEECMRLQHTQCWLNHAARLSKPGCLQSRWDPSRAAHLACGPGTWILSRMPLLGREHAVLAAPEDRQTLCGPGRLRRHLQSSDGFQFLFVGGSTPRC